MKVDSVDLGMNFGSVFDPEMVPKWIYGSRWESQGCQLGVVGSRFRFHRYLMIFRGPGRGRLGDAPPMEEQVFTTRSPGLVPRLYIYRERERERE